MELTAAEVSRLWDILVSARGHLGKNLPVLADRQIQNAQRLLWPDMSRPLAGHASHPSEPSGASSSAVTSAARSKASSKARRTDTGSSAAVAE